MGFRAVFSIILFLSIFSVFIFSEDNQQNPSFAVGNLNVSLYATETSDFENLDWQPLYPGEILGISESKIKFSTGFFVDRFHGTAPDVLPGGVYFALRPEMHFLVFDGKFNVMIRSYSSKDDFFFDIANREISDYFESIRLKYRDLKFLFGDSAVFDGELLYLPSSDYYRRYIGFDFNYSDWNFNARSVDWKSWAGKIETPSLGNDFFRMAVESDVFFDASASTTIAASIGPEISLWNFNLTPVVGYVHQDDSLNSNSKLPPYFQNAEINDDFFTFGCKCGYDSELLKADFGLNFSRITEYYANISVKPLSMSFGRRYDMSRTTEDIISWTKVSWILSDEEGFSTGLGFGTNDSAMNGFSSFTFFELKKTFESGLGLEFTFKNGENTELFIGIEYSFGLTDFYKES